MGCQRPSVTRGKTAILALLGAKVFIGARTLSKTQSAISQLLQASPTIPPSLLHPFVIDLGDLQSVKSTAEAFLLSEPRLDILINNAGLMRPLNKDVHGISVSFGTNHLGPFLLTTTLLPLLTHTTTLPNTSVRIVNVSSITHYEVPPTARYDSLTSFNESFGREDSAVANYTRYAYAKLANVIFTQELQRRFDAKDVPILALSVHPGGVGTNGSAAYLGGRDNDVFRGALMPFEGAITPLFAAVHTEVSEQEEKYKGRFLMPFGAVREMNPMGRDEGLGRELWERSEEVVRGVLEGDV
ncbi:NAD(P)-binding protein [Amniculicola lignicola CBS 123094]|uniref:NAD(P)-binding protein n=1 Tax=Amniculicola lignicola CBS 123094 TaxID=1392246 RepID=A0A6A5WPC1_9PLEO|nr:NAD(P)-binding protein [Amniculicola lignicola CBS 123094]